MNRPSRIARLAASVGAAVPAVPRSPRALAVRTAPVTRAFDTGEDVVVHAVAPAPAGNPTTQVPAVTLSPPNPPEEEYRVADPLPAASPPNERSEPSASRPAVTSNNTGPDPDPTEDAGGWTLTASATDEAFAQDIRAILEHSGALASGSHRVPLPDVPQPPPPPVATAPEHGVSASQGHDVFDRLAAASTPNRFDQGPVALSVDFAGLDRALAKNSVEVPVEPASPVAPPVAVPPPVPDTSPAPGPEPEPPATSAFRVTTDVPLVPQVPGLSCHAAACASLVAWRDEIVPDPAAIAGGAGYWEKYASGRTAASPDVFTVFGLTTVSAGRPPGADTLRELVDTRGPLFASASPPADHAVVIAGVSSDGGNSAPMVEVVDPWDAGTTSYTAPNAGSTYTVPLADLLARLGAGPDHHILLAHL